MKPPPDPDVEAALRASLEAHARQAPRGDDLADRILAATGPTGAPQRSVVPLRPRHTWGRFTIPAAAAVLAAIIGIVVAFVAYDPDRGAPPAAETNRPTPARPTAPSTSPVTSAPTTADRTPSTSSTVPAGPIPLHGVKIFDLSFTGTNDGWALASSQCIDNPAQRCTAILHSTDGKRWLSNPGGAPGNVVDVDGCSDPCVDHLRFATDEIGYAYGPDALFMTTDGGAHWNQQPGLGADALETLNGTVLLVRVSDPAARLLLTAPIGSTAWTPFTDPGLGAATGVTALDRAGHTVVLQTFADRGDGSGTYSLFRSPDDGATWQRIADPCPAPTAGGTAAPTNAALAADGSTVVVACTSSPVNRPRHEAGRTVTSTDGGQTFGGPGAALGASLHLAVAGQDTQLVIAHADASGAGLGLYRSTNGGSTWNPVPNIPLSGVVFLGFENERVGRLVVDGSRSVIWTTRNGGATWTKVDLP